MLQIWQEQEQYFSSASNIREIATGSECICLHETSTCFSSHVLDSPCQNVGILFQPLLSPINLLKIRHKSSQIHKFDFLRQFGCQLVIWWFFSSAPYQFVWLGPEHPACGYKFRQSEYLTQNIRFQFQMQVYQCEMLRAPTLDLRVQPGNIQELRCLTLIFSVLIGLSIVSKVIYTVILIAIHFVVILYNICIFKFRK